MDQVSDLRRWVTSTSELGQSAQEPHLSVHVPEASNTVSTKSSSTLCIIVNVSASLYSVQDMNRRMLIQNVKNYVVPLCCHALYIITHVQLSHKGLALSIDQTSSPLALYSRQHFDVSPRDCIHPQGLDTTWDNRTYRVFASALKNILTINSSSFEKLE